MTGSLKICANDDDGMAGAARVKRDSFTNRVGVETYPFFQNCKYSKREREGGR